ncbi:MAG: 3-hydroxyisobutyryl-CoA hydrolase [Pseudonocardia sp. SCN 72-86]|nr:MAG: 3-hydroxyisobutyryl-CoA hydrolase [Pseudonocardia sp. SCN 72-86]
MTEPSTTTTAGVDDVLVERVGVIGRIVLNRPKALNALTHGMVLRIEEALLDWVDDDAVRAVVLTGAGDRGLCAGGDIVAIYRDTLAGGTATRDFWRDEYRLNALIGSYPKPFVAVMDGIVMGGGIGVSAHAGMRIVTERTRIAMPEVGIGLVPDVGGSWLLARAPGELGTHAALSATNLGAGDALEMGFADWYVESDRVQALVAAICAVPAGEDDVASEIGLLIADVTGEPPGSSLGPSRLWIDECYAVDTAEEIVARLETSGHPDAEAAAKEIGRKSPTCVKVALAALRRVRDMTSLEEALDQEFRVSLRCFAAPDLAEGIRAQVIDKDRNPQWRPAALEQVTDEQVQAYLAPLDDELGLAEGTR